MHPDTTQKVNQLVKELTHLFEEKLLSVCVYGSSLFQQEGSAMQQKQSDINVLIILSTLTPTDLEKASSVAKWWEKTANALPLFFSEAEWQCSEDVFALEYADIRDNHQVVYGTDYFSDKAVDAQALRLVLELELNRKLIFLRQRLLLQRDKPKILLEMMQQSINSIAALFRGILRLQPGHSDIPQKAPDVFSALQGIIPEYDSAPFLQIIESKAASTKLHQTQVFSLYNHYIQQIGIAIQYVDRYLQNSPVAQEGVSV